MKELPSTGLSGHSLVVGHRVLFGSFCGAIPSTWLKSSWIISRLRWLLKPQSSRPWRQQEEKVGGRSTASCLFPLQEAYLEVLTKSVHFHLIGQNLLTWEIFPLQVFYRYRDPALSRRKAILAFGTTISLSSHWLTNASDFCTIF